MIIGSMTFAKEMLETKERLEKLGHSVIVPYDTDTHIKDSCLIDNLDEDLKHLTKNDILKKCFDLVAQSDAVLILNHPKNNIDGYMGTSTLIETGIAYHLNKKIFLLNNIPASEKHRWAHEVRAMKPILINGDISKIIN